MFFTSPKGTRYFNFMRYHDVSIENTCCHQPSSIVLESVRIYDHIKVSLIGQSLLLTLA